MPLSAGWVEVVESGSGYIAHPEILSLATTDPGAAVARLRAAGFDVEPPAGSREVWGSMLIGGGVRVLVVDAG